MTSNEETSGQNPAPNPQTPPPADAAGQANAGDGQFWLRVLYTVGFGFIAYFGLCLIFLVSLVQAVFLLISKKKNEDVEAFGANLSQYLAQVIAYVSWASEEKPFPAAPFPSGIAPR